MILKLIFEAQYKSHGYAPRLMRMPPSKAPLQLTIASIVYLRFDIHSKPAMCSHSRRRRARYDVVVRLSILVEETKRWAGVVVFVNVPENGDLVEGLTSHAVPIGLGVLD